MIHLDNEHKKYLKRAVKWFSLIFSDKSKRAFDGNSLGDHIELQTADACPQPSPLFNKEIYWVGFLLDSGCIAWMLEVSMDANVIMDIMRFIPEVVLYAGIRTAPLERLYGMVLECLDRSSGRLVVIPKLRDKAYPSTKALFHFTIQHKCVSNKSDKMVFNSISHRHQITGHKRYEGDSVLEPTLGTIDRVFGDFESMHHQNFSLTALRHAWMGRTPLYHTWDVIIGECEPLPDDIDEFILPSLRLELLPLAPIVADSVYRWFGLRNQFAHR